MHLAPLPPRYYGNGENSINPIFFLTRARKNAARYLPDDRKRRFGMNGTLNKTKTMNGKQNVSHYAAAALIGALCLIAVAGCMPYIMPVETETIVMMPPTHQQEQKYFAVPLITSLQPGDNYVSADAVNVFEIRTDGSARQLRAGADAYSVELWDQDPPSSGSSSVYAPAGVLIQQFRSSVPSDKLKAGRYEVKIKVGGVEEASYSLAVFDTKSPEDVDFGLDPLFVVVPYKTTYVDGDYVDPIEDLAVYTRDTATGAMNKVPANGFTATLNLAEGKVDVRVLRPEYDKPVSYPINVINVTENWMLVTPARTTYQTGDKIENADLTVFAHEAGVTKVKQPNDFTVQADGTAADGKFNAPGLQKVTVTVPGFPTSYEYWVWVIPATSFVPNLVVVPLKTTYTRGDPLAPLNDLVVYKYSAGSGMTRLDYAPSSPPPGAGRYTLTASGGTPYQGRDPVTEGFVTGGAYTVTVTDTDPSSPAPDETYTVNAIAGRTAFAMVVPYKTSYVSGELIDKADDFDVYQRDMATGELTKTEKNKVDIFWPYPAKIEGNPGDVKTVIVEIVDYPAAGGAPYEVSYKVRVGPPATAVTPFVQTVPLHTAYTAGDSIQQGDVAVFTCDSSGAMTRVSDDGTHYEIRINGEARDDFISSDVNLDAGRGAGKAKVEIEVFEFPTPVQTASAAYYVSVSKAATAQVSIVPVKRYYTKGSEIKPDKDIVVFKRNLQNGNSERVSPGSFTLDPSGPLTDTGLKQIQVSIPGYGAGSYWITVDDPAAYETSLMLVPLKRNYGVGEKIVPNDDLVVYRSEAGGVKRLSYKANADGYTLCNEAGAEIDVAQYTFQEDMLATGIVPFIVKDTILSNVSAELKLLVVPAPAGTSGYQGELTAKYTNNITEILKRNSLGQFVPTTPRNQTIYSVTTAGGDEYYIGRNDSTGLTLNLDVNGKLNFREPLIGGKTAGFIPVSTWAELAKINDDAGTRHGKYVLENDVDLLGDVMARPQMEWMPIGRDDSNAFTGVFDGGMYTLRNLKISSLNTEVGDSVGLFGVAKGALIRNVKTTGAIDVSKNYAGGIAGTIKDGWVYNCWNSASVRNTSATANHIGGIAGYIVGSHVAACKNTGVIQGTRNAGGLAGTVTGSTTAPTIYASYNEGTVYSTGTGSVFVGGIAGFVSATEIRACYNTAVIMGLVFGQAGSITGGAQSGSIVQDCYWRRGTADWLSGSSQSQDGVYNEGAFPNVANPLKSQWGTGNGWDGMEAWLGGVRQGDVWWDANTVGGGSQLPKLWWEGLNPQSALPAFAPLVQAAPLKTEYISGQSINKASDLAVYRRDLTDGAMVQVPVSGFTIIDPPETNGQFDAANGPAREVTVRVKDYPAAGRATDVRYTVRVASGPTLYLQIYKTAYSTSERINGSTDLIVYRNTAGSLTRLYHGTGFLLEARGVNAAATDFTFGTEGVHVITVKDMAIGLSKAESQTYGVTVKKEAGDLGDYVGDLGDYAGVLTARYKDNTTATMTKNSLGKWKVQSPKNAKIYSITAINPVNGDPRTYLAGRMDNEGIALNLDSRGVLRFRLPLTETAGSAAYGSTTGFIPVSTVEELLMISEEPETLRGKYLLEADIDLLGGSDTPSALRREWKPIGANSEFSGIFDGGKHMVSNMTITNATTGAAEVGFVSKLKYGLVRNLKVAGTVDVSNKAAAGGIVGRMELAWMYNCENRAAVTNYPALEDQAAGGLAGSIGINTNIEASRNNGAITGWKSGGISGVTSGAGFKIISCINTGAVKGYNMAGGITGSASGGGNPVQGVIIGCAANGKVNEGVTAVAAGWLVGRVDGAALIVSNMTTITITGGNYVGQLGPVSAPWRQVTSPNYSGTNLPGVTSTVPPSQPWLGTGDPYDPDRSPPYLPFANPRQVWVSGGASKFDSTMNWARRQWDLPDPLGGWYNVTTTGGGATTGGGTNNLPRFWWE
jgi:hypothetical protein